MPEPDWSFMGSVGGDLWVWTYSEFGDGELFRAGWMDLSVEFYDLPEYNALNDDNYAIAKVSLAEMDPGWDGDVNGRQCNWSWRSKHTGPQNERAELSIDWNQNNDLSPTDLIDYKPGSGESGDYSYSASISASAAGPQAGVGVSYDPNVITRQPPERTGDKVTWEWIYNHTIADPNDIEAQYYDTAVEAASACRLADPTSMDPNLAQIDFTGTWAMVLRNADPEPGWTTSGNLTKDVTWRDVE